MVTAIAAAAATIIKKTDSNPKYRKVYTCSLLRGVPYTLFAFYNAAGISPGDIPGVSYSGSARNLQLFDLREDYVERPELYRICEAAR